MSSAYLYGDNDNVIEIDQFRDAVLGTYLNAATVGARVLSTAGVEVIANQSMTYVAASNGKYRVSIDKTVVGTLADETIYDLEITGAEAGLDYRRLIRVRFRKRRDT